MSRTYFLLFVFLSQMFFFEGILRGAFAQAATGTVEMRRCESAPVSGLSRRQMKQIFEALKNHQFHLIQRLLDQGLEIRGLVVNGDPFVLILAERGYLDWMEKIDELGLGASFDEPNVQDLTPLHVAVEKKDRPMVEFLLKKGADPNRMDGKGQTSVHIAAKRGNLEIFKLLLESGGSPDCPSSPKGVKAAGTTPLHWAALHGHLSIVKFLLKNSEIVERTEFPDLVNRNGLSPLHAAAEGDHIEVIQLLLKNGANPVLKDEDGRTPLHLAAYGGRWKAAVVLANAILERSRALTASNSEEDQSPLDIRDDHKKTPLFMAAEFGKARVVKELLRLGAKTQCLDQNEMSPLFVAHWKDYDRVIFEFFDSGAIDINYEIQVARNIKECFRDYFWVEHLRDKRKEECPREFLLKEVSGVFISARNVERLSEDDLDERAQVCFQKVQEMPALLLLIEKKTHEYRLLEEEIENFKTPEQKKLENQLSELRLTKYDAFSSPSQVNRSALQRSNNLKARDLEIELEKMKSDDQIRAERGLSQLREEILELEVQVQCPSCDRPLINRKGKGDFVQYACEHWACRNCNRNIRSRPPMQFGHRVGDPSCSLCRGDICDRTMMEIMAKLNIQDPSACEGEQSGDSSIDLEVLSD